MIAEEKRIPVSWGLLEVAERINYEGEGKSLYLVTHAEDGNTSVWITRRGAEKAKAKKEKEGIDCLDIQALPIRNSPEVEEAANLVSEIPFRTGLSYRGQAQMHSEMFLVASWDIWFAD